MSMLTLLFKQNKDLVVTTPNVRIYQGENYADALQVIIPKTYGDYDLSDFSLSLNYVDPTNIVHAETMVKSEEPYKDDFLAFTLPLDSEFTKAAGPLKIKIDLIHLDDSTQTGVVIHSNENEEVEVLTWDDYFKYVPPAQIGIIDAKILELQNEAARLKSVEEALDKTIPNDLKITEDVLQLSKDGEPIGDGVEVYVAGDQDDEDDDHDGVIDLDTLKEGDDDGSDALASNGLTFIEL